MRPAVATALCAASLLAIPAASQAQSAAHRAPATRFSHARLVAALNRAQSAEWAEKHPLYVTFRTRAPGVVVPPELLQRFPQEMTIVLQYHYSELQVGEAGFSVLLTFSGQPAQLTVPYDAVGYFREMNPS